MFINQWQLNRLNMHIKTTMRHFDWRSTLKINTTVMCAFSGIVDNVLYTHFDSHNIQLCQSITLELRSHF